MQTFQPPLVSSGLRRRHSQQSLDVLAHKNGNNGLAFKLEHVKDRRKVGQQVAQLLFRLVAIRDVAHDVRARDGRRSTA